MKIDGVTEEAVAGGVAVMRLEDVGYNFSLGLLETIMLEMIKKYLIECFHLSGYWMKVFIVFLCILLPVTSEANSEKTSYSFGVLPQRSVMLTAQYWNPILGYIKQQTGITLDLKPARSGQESVQSIEKGEVDFIYSNHFFQPRLSVSGYKVILKPRTQTIKGQVVVLDTSSIQKLEEINSQPVGFPSKSAFVAYIVPMDHLLRNQITVQTVFGGNQEGIMGQLLAGKVVAACVNDQVMRLFAQRTKMNYRVLWESVAFENLPIAAHPRVQHDVVEAVQKAFSTMHETQQGIDILEESAKIINQDPPFGFIVATHDDYKNYTEFYNSTVVKDYE
ncbi:MAG: phosphate/phosphite/phosphonate ABC transporter substrate-binding protein [Magnetococcales bacterium]|nr:phosphate/phosphite/phosphonate ABC transporter substrate-binding protein [Magnetococcales bacterium]